jgi:CubicO group peptidase (beta-lactamase class C family)
MHRHERAVRLVAIAIVVWRAAIASVVRRVAIASVVRRVGIAIVAATAVAVCATVRTGTADAAAAGGPPSAVSAVAIPPGQIDRAVASLDRLANDLMRRSGVPGMAIAVVHDDTVVYSKGFGVREVGTNKRVDRNTIFQLASVSKPLGATVVAGAVGRGTVQWSDPVAKYLPGFTLSDPYVGTHVTIADMYAHRSGLPGQAGDLLEDLGYDRTAIIARLALEPLDPFRTVYHYANFGLTAGGEAVAKAAGTTWEDLSQDVLYGPLGMTSTSSRFSDYRKALNRALLHVRVGSRWLARYTREPDAQSPAGGASSSVRDMAQWLRLELANGKYNGKQIIDEAALLQTRVPHIATGPPATPISRTSFYGLGMGVEYDAAGRLRLSHAGAFAVGASTAIAMLPSEKLGIVVLTNAMPVGVSESLTSEFLDLAEFGKVQRDWFADLSKVFAAMLANQGMLANKTPPANPAPAQPPAAYAGSYANAFYGPASIVSKDGRLVMVLGPRNVEFPLTHWDGNTFSYVPVGEDASGLQAVTFTIGADGRAATFVVENFNTDKLGTFTRT